LEEGVRVERGSRTRDESGQVLVLTALFLVMMLTMVAFVVDIGKAYLVQRQLQASVDAAALAGAQHLPDPTDATNVATQYGPGTGGKNAVQTGHAVNTTVTMRCVQSAPGCNVGGALYNALNVRASTDVSMSFARVIGIDKLTVRASATACSPCSAKPLDIMLVIDRTGSMCRTGSGGYERPLCPDLKNAKDGMKTFLSLMDPTIDKVGLALTPPVLDASWISSCPSPNGYLPWNSTPNPNVPSGHPARNFNGRFYAIAAYWPSWIPDPLGSTPAHYTVAPLEQNYLVRSGTSWILNPSSNLVQRIDCAGAEGSTTYALAIEEAQRQLDRNGDGNVQDVIVFLGDGAANSSSMNVPTGHWTNNPSNQARPCGTAVESAQRSKDRGTIVFTIGYDLNGEGTDYERCLRPDANGRQQASIPANYEACGTWGCTAYDAIRAMATDPDGPGTDPPFFYNKPNPGQLNTIFTRIAADLQRPAARLIDDDTP
jgi:Flp pilus assembly protein TadG